ncbi:hypothetical protein [Ruegeria sp. Alg231-54]|uniref:hypothetical protein n=1 Tax=Ruegeria sp. Alg231-54 TaxID=1922221 RepID=UPI00131EDD07|nr:hypothetical protein [Ruegeria sp. Alg231-54]
MNWIAPAYARRQAKLGILPTCLIGVAGFYRVASPCARQPNSIRHLDPAFAHDVVASHDESERKDTPIAPITMRPTEIRPQKHQKQSDTSK